MIKFQTPEQAARDKLAKDLHRHEWYEDWLNGSCFFRCKCGARATKSLSDKEYTIH